MIGSQIVRNLVTETKDSLKYIVQSFDLITKARGIGEGKKAKKSSDDFKQKEQFVQRSVTQNVPKKTPKLIRKGNRRSKTSKNLKETIFEQEQQNISEIQEHKNGISIAKLEDEGL